MHRLTSMLPATTVLIVMWCTAGCASWKRFAYEGFGRDAWQKPDEVIAALAIHPGEQIADIGSGGGYFTFRFAQVVGSSGKVYAVDIDQDMTDYVAARARDEGLANVDVILARVGDPLLPAAGVDLIFTSNTYHHIENRVAYFANARKYLHRDGRVAVVELAGKSWFSKWFGHYTPSETIRREMEAAGYHLEHEFSFLPRQHFLVFSVAVR